MLVLADFANYFIFGMKITPGVFPLSEWSQDSAGFFLFHSPNKMILGTQRCYAYRSYLRCQFHRPQG